MGRERGCWVYVPLAELAKLKYRGPFPPPFYRVSGRAGGRTAVVEFRAE